MIIVVMGVSGAGKTTVGSLLAEDLGWPYYEGDDYHPPSNVEKMSRGIPLNDDDRRPWLDRLRTLIQDTRGQDRSCVIACSALKQTYRSIEIIVVDIRDEKDIWHIVNFLKSIGPKSRRPELKQRNDDG